LAPRLSLSSLPRPPLPGSAPLNTLGLKLFADEALPCHTPPVFILPLIWLGLHHPRPSPLRNQAGFFLTFSFSWSSGQSVHKINGTPFPLFRRLARCLGAQFFLSDRSPWRPSSRTLFFDKLVSGDSVSAIPYGSSSSLHFFSLETSGTVSLRACLVDPDNPNKGEHISG